MNPLPSIDQVFSLVAQEEHQRTIGHTNPSVESISLLVPADNHRRPQYTIGQDQFKRREYQRPHCTHCNTKGHVIDRCYKLHGYPPGYRQGNTYSSSSHQKGKQSSDSQFVPQPKAPSSAPQSSFLASLTTEQYAQLATML